MSPARPRGCERGELHNLVTEWIREDRLLFELLRRLNARSKDIRLFVVASLGQLKRLESISNIKNESGALIVWDNFPASNDDYFTKRFIT